MNESDSPRAPDNGRSSPVSSFKFTHDHCHWASDFLGSFLPVPSISEPGYGWCDLGGHLGQQKVADYCATLSRRARQILVIKEQISLFVRRTFLVWALKSGSWFCYFWSPLIHPDHPPCLQIGSPSPGCLCRAHLPVSPFLACPIPYGGKHSYSCFLGIFIAVYS